MKITEGYNGKELEIRISGRKYGNAELWLEQHGLSDECSRYRETLSYISLSELIQLKREIDIALMTITGLDEDS